MRRIDISNAQAVQGWMADEELQFLAEAAATRDIVVEVGSWRGRSTTALADHAGVKVYAVDHWKGIDDCRPIHDKFVTWETLATPYSDADAGVDMFAEFSKNLAGHLKRGKVEALRMSSVEGALELARRGVAPDMVFIDGDHSENAVRVDIAVWRGILKPGGLLCGHDYDPLQWHAGVRSVVDAAFPVVRVVGSIWSVTP